MKKPSFVKLCFYLFFIVSVSYTFHIFGQENVVDTLTSEYYNSLIGKPDIILSIQFPMVIPANEKEAIYNFLIPFQLNSDTNVSCIEFKPLNHSVVMKATIMVFNLDKESYYDDPKDLMTFQTFDGTEFHIDSFAKSNLVYSGIWLNGNIPQVWKDNIGFIAPKNGLALLSIHYKPGDTAQTDQSAICLFFKKNTIQRNVTFFVLGSGGLVEPNPELIIPADSIKKFRIEATVPMDFSVLSIQTNMHFLGKSFFAFAVNVIGDTIPLIKKNDWDFRFRKAFIPKQMLILPRGTRIYAEAVFDNTKNNPANPNKPPKSVKQGWRTTDEMMNLIFTSVPYLTGDEMIELH